MINPARKIFYWKCFMLAEIINELAEEDDQYVEAALSEMNYQAHKLIGVL